MLWSIQLKSLNKQNRVLWMNISAWLFFYIVGRNSFQCWWNQLGRVCEYSKEVSPCHCYFHLFPTLVWAIRQVKKVTPRKYFFRLDRCVRSEGSFVFSNMCYNTRQADINVSSAQLAFGVWNKPPDNQELLGRKGSPRKGSVRLKIFCSSSDITERQVNVLYQSLLDS